MAKRRITIEDLFRLRVIGDIVMSPDGARVAFSMKRQDFKANKTYSNLYVVPVRGGRVRPLTHGKNMDAHPKWSPNGECIGFMSNRDKASCVWLLPMTGGEAVRLTDRDGDASDFAFSPDGKYVAYAYRSKSEREKLERDGKKDEIARGPQYKHIKRLWHKLDGVGFWNGNYKHIHRVRVSGSGSEQLTDGDYDDDKPQYSPNGKHLAFLSNRTANPDLELMNQDIYVMPAGGGRIRKVTPKLGSIDGYSWAPDSKRFAYLGYLGKSRDYIHHVTGAWTVELTGKGTRCLTKSIDNNCLNVTIADVSEITFEGEPPIWSADGSRIYFVVSEHGACRLYEAPLGRGSPRMRVGGDLVVNSVRRTAPSGPLALVICDALNPGDIHVWDPDEDDAEPRRITQVNRGVLGGLLLSRPEVFACHRGRHTVHGWVLKPPGFKKGRKYPMVLEIHGGPQAQYGHLFFHEMQWLAANGYVVLYTNPRGSVGYGLEFCRALHPKWGEPDYPDLMACVDKLLKTGYVDRKRLYVAGGSYGGFMTLWVVGHTKRFRAAVTQRCVSNMESEAGASDFGWDIAWVLDAMPWENPARYRKHSPATYLPKVTTPLLVIHSENDLRCPIDQAEQVFTTMKYLDKEVEFVRFEGESHGLSRGGRPQNRAERLRRILDWFERHK